MGGPSLPWKGTLFLVVLAFLHFSVSPSHGAPNFYIGCYADFPSRTLPYLYSDNSQVPSSCMTGCANAGYAYAGVQYGGQCFCGNTLPKVISTNCNQPCSADNRLICGSSWANSVYATGIYKGCYADSASRTLPYLAGASDYTPTTCILACGAAGYSFAGVQYGGQCFCGNTLPPTTSTSCNMKCSDGSTICGGFWANSVYSVPPSMFQSYKGCFADAEARTLPYLLSGALVDTPATCIAGCARVGYAYAGVQYFGQCFCGNDLPSTATLRCNTPCSTDGSQMCGGAWANSVYSTLTLPDAATVRYYFPASVHYALGENCENPMSSGGTSGVILYNVQPHPKNHNVVLLTFGMAFQQDCGHAGHSGAHGADSHPGDIEYFSYTLKPDSSCAATGWQLFSIKTIAHSADYKRREINENRMRSCSGPGSIVSSLGKHAVYLSWMDCTKRTPAEVCLDGPVVPQSGFKFYYIYSPGLAPDLAQIMAVATGNPSNGKDKIWSSEGDGRFCGGQQIGNRGDCVGAPSGSLVGPSPIWTLPDPNLGDDDRCPYGLEFNAGLCYQYCNNGYYGAATMCIPTCPADYTNTGLYCNKDTYGRGVGTIPDQCPSGYYKSGALCYPNCRDGYSGVGPVCWGSCPSGYTDTGALCQANTYYKGGCCCTIFGCCGCRSGYTDMGCFCQTSGASTVAKGSYGNGAGSSLSCGPNLDEWGGLCYTKCRAGFSNSACCICMKSGCPVNTIDIGVACQKITYDRGVGCLP